MVSGDEGKLGDASDEADLAKAFQAIAQGEMTATQLENHLDQLESRIEELMKQANANQDLVQQAAANQSSEGDTATDPPKPGANEDRNK